MTFVGNSFTSPTLDATLNEGLPYWIFWFLLAVILLLLFFIFLRDKELRRRIDFFFLSAKKKSLQVHWERQVRREKRKRDRWWQELGKYVYQKKLSVAGAEAIISALDSLAKKKEHWLVELRQVKEKIENLETGKNLPEENITAAGQLHPEKTNNPGLSGIPLSQNKPREIKAESKLWKRRQKKVEAKIKDLEEHEKVFLMTIGRLVDTLRFSPEELQDFYQRIDEINARIIHLEQRLDSLHPF